GSGSLTSQGILDVEGAVVLDALTLNNQGAATAGTFGSGVNWTFADGAVFNNQAGATFADQWGSLYVNGSGRGTVNNFAAFAKTGADVAGQTTFQFAFNNQAGGSVDVQQGILRMFGSQDGSFTGSAGTELAIEGTLSNSSSVAGDLVVHFTGATIVDSF